VKTTLPAIFLSGSGIRNEKGEITAGVVLFRDITASIELEQMKNDFLALVSHDLRNPVALIVGYGEVMVELSKQKFNLGFVTRETSALIAETHQLQNGITACIQVEVEENLPAVPFDLNRFEQILTNLISNALKFSAFGSPVIIRLQTQVETGGVLVSVQDSGLGIEAETLPELFNRFYRAKIAREKGYKGMGLGLYLCRLLIEAHGGKIWAESAGLNQGSTFFLTLPPE
jgi:signal transduction histidine kinase